MPEVTRYKPMSFEEELNNNCILWNVSVIPEAVHFGWAEHLAWVQESVCCHPDQIVVKGNSHMNVIHAQAQA